MKNTIRPVALLINDIHVSKDNIPEFNKNWDEALEIASSLKIEDIVVGGDLWQSRSGQTLDTLLAVRSAIKKTRRAKIYLTIAEGNHDLVDQEALLGYSHIFDGYEGVDVVEEYTVLELGDINLFVMSYFPEKGSFVDRLKRIVKEEFALFNNGYKNLLYIHQGIRGGLKESSEDELPANIFDDFDTVLVGHYHDRKQVPGYHIFYIGSSRQHNFGEDEEKGYTILYSDGSTKFIKNEVNTRYKTIEIDYCNLDSDFMDELSELSKDPRYKLKVKVRCSQNETSSISKDKMIEAGVSKVEIVKDTAEITRASSRSLDQKFDKGGIKKEYADFCEAKEIDAEMGIKYLDKIN